MYDTHIPIAIMLFIVEGGILRIMQWGVLRVAYFITVGRGDLPGV